MVNKRGVLLPSSRSKMSRVKELKSLDLSSHSLDVGPVIGNEKGLGHYEEVILLQL